MKANELMSGDYLSYNGQIIKVASITKKKVGYHIKENECRMHYARLCECNQVSITPEILEKNGFRVREDTDDTEYYYYDGYRINVDFYEGLPEDDIPPTIFLSIDFAEKDITMPIEYVHELQRALRLFKINKDIVL